MKKDKFECYVILPLNSLRRRASIKEIAIFWLIYDHINAVLV